MSHRPDRRRSWIPAVLITLAVGVPIPALAGSPRTHDGLFLRLSGGLGNASTGIDDVDFFGTPADVEMSGLSGDGNFALGGIIGTNLAIHGTAWGWTIGDPDIEVNEAEGDLDGNLSLSAIGGGVTYYFMPVNIYLSGSVGPAWLSLDVDDDEETSDMGIALDVTLGKEWWVGGSWGLGIAGTFGYHTVPDENVDENWSGVSFGGRFSATLN